MRRTGRLVIGGWALGLAASLTMPRLAAGQCSHGWLPRQGHPVSVRAMCVYQGDVIAGGSFTVDGSTIQGLARWTGTDWQFLEGTRLGPDSYSAGVCSLAVYRGQLIAGGVFREIGGTGVVNIARWDGTSWHNLASGLSGTVFALAVYRDQLVAGGDFVHAGGLRVAGLAAWDGGQWRALGGGVADWSLRFQGVRCLAVHGSDLIVGGPFQGVMREYRPHDPDAFIDSAAIARWDGSEWHGFGAGMTAPALHASVDALASWSEKLVAGGYFVAADGVEANYIAQWDGQAWTSLGGGVEPIVLLDVVCDLAVYDQALIAAGRFRTAGGVAVSGIARWDGQVWHDMVGGLEGGESSSAIARELFVHDGRLWVAGEFESVDGIASSNFARWGPVGTSDVAADLDRDCDVDGDDLTVLIACGSGPQVPYDAHALPPGCTLSPDGGGRIAADLDGDGDVDQADFGRFQACITGSEGVATPGCDSSR